MLTLKEINDTVIIPYMGEETMKKIFLIVLVFCFTVITPNALEDTKFSRLSEVEKFEIISLEIDELIQNESFSYDKILSLLTDLDIKSFNFETGNEFKSRSDLADQIYVQAKSYTSSKLNAKSQTLSTIYEGGLNYEVQGWNYYGAYLNQQKSAQFSYSLGKHQADLALSVATLASITTLFGPIAPVCIALVGGWNIHSVTRAINDINYLNGPNGLFITRNIFTNSYSVRKQISGRPISGQPYTGGCAGCGFGGGGGGTWSVQPLYN